MRRIKRSLPRLVGVHEVTVGRAVPATASRRRLEAVGTARPTKLAAGDTPHVANSGGQGRGETVVSPALLFEELDLAKIDRDFDKPPILPTPLAREAAD